MDEAKSRRPMTDTATVGFTTLVGSLIGGPVGAVAGIWKFYSFYHFIINS
jgi:hypothetical protein